MKTSHDIKMEKYASVEAECGGVPVYSFNNLIYVFGESPDFYPEAKLQLDNDNPVQKIKLKKTWEMKHNFIGNCHEMTPRTRLNDSQPYLPVHLIDGDPETIWSSFECHVPDGREEWIRIDLPMEREIAEVRLTCKKKYMNKTRAHWHRVNWFFGNALPNSVSVKASRDAWHWDTVAECKDIYDAENGAAYGSDKNDPDGVSFVFTEPVRAKQIMITGFGLTKIGYDGFMFSVNGVNLFDKNGKDWALISNGAGVTVSSTSDAHNSDRYSANSLWGQLQYDLGNKWIKVGSDNGSLMWCFTEHEDGVLRVDEEADKALKEAKDNGINIMMTVDFKGNWAYDGPFKKHDWRRARYTDICDSYLGGVPMADESPEMYAGYLRFAEFMAGHFKDRVKMYEIGNEWHLWNDDLDWYMNKIFEPTYDAIKRGYPDANIMLGSTAGFHKEIIYNCIGPGVKNEDGKIYVTGSVVLTAKPSETVAKSVGAAVCCGGAAGLIVQSRDKRHFTAAVYNPNENKIFFKRGRSEHVFAFDFWDRKEEAVETACLGDEVKMSAEINGKNVTFAVESISGSASTQITVEDADGGGWGIIAFPGFGQSIFSNIKINGNNYGGDWDIYRNHWNRPDRPAAAYRLAGIGWHASNNPENAYFDDVARFKKDCEKMGYSAGFYSCNEIYAAATYPPGPQENNQFRMTDIGEAKYLVGAMAAYGAVNIMSGPCHISFTGYPHPQATCRTTVPAQIAVPSQPKPSHYGIRNIANIMDGFYQATFETEISDSKNLLSLPVLNPDTGEKMLLLMLESPYGNYQSETLLERTVDVIFKNATAKNVTGLDAFNGTAQELTFAAGADTIVKNVVVKDYPIFIKIN